ncbi:MAG TPA: tetratricopeptide repeat protein [Tepidisphaeraceae bacterium]|nr:tetratricopeptide repeat protein [Tepidisphaeraceae bacterium]
MAEQEQPVRRRVALKIIKLGMDTKQVVARFEAERQALAMMDHPNIAKVFDAGSTETGRPYFVMELVKGIPITEYCDRQKLSPRQRLELFLQVCAAVQHAHQKGIIHRDLKPSNVLVTLVDDGKPTPKVIDFGIAKATAGQRLTDRTLFTEFRQLIGTPIYMSPEQAEMSQLLDIDTRSDVYSLGVLLYELLTGETPFDQKRLRAAAFDEMLRIIRDEEPPKPSTRLNTSDSLPSIAVNRQLEPSKLATTISGDLDWIVMKALQKDRARRYETATALAEDIRRHLSDLPVSAHPPSKADRFRKFARRNKAALLSITFVAIALLVGTVVSTWQAVRATQAKREALAERDNKDRALREAEEVSNYLTSAFSSPDPSRDGRTITIAEVLDRDVKELKEKFKDNPHTKADLLEAIGKTYQGLGLYNDAIPLLEQSIELRKSILGPDHPDIIWRMQNLATAYWQGRGPQTALPLAQQVLKWQMERLGPDHLETLQSAVQVASLCNAVGRHQEALLMIEDAVKRLKQKVAADDPVLFWPMNFQADIYIALERPEEAVPIYEQLLRLRKEKLGSDHRDTLFSMDALAICYQKAGRLDDAVSLFNETIRLRIEKLGPGHPETRQSLNHLLDTCAAMKEYGHAVEIMERLAATLNAKLGPNHPETLAVDSELGHFYYRGSQGPKAVTVLEDTLKRQRAVLGNDHLDTIQTIYYLATAQRTAGHGDLAMPLYEERLKLQEARLGENHPDTIHSMVDLADFSVRVLKDNQRAISLYERLIVIKPNEPQYYLRLAQFIAGNPDPNLRDPRRAEELIQQAIAIDPSSADAWALLGAQEYRNGNFQSSIDAMEKSKALSPNQAADANQCFVLAMAHWQVGHKDIAREWYDRALNSAKEHPKESQSAVDHYQGEAADLLGREVSSVRYLSLRAGTEAAGKQWDKAAADYVAAIDLSTDGMSSKSQRKMICRDIIKSSELFDRVVKLRPDETTLWLCQGQDLAQRNQWADAAGAYAKVIGSRKLPDYLDYGGLLLLSADPDGYRRFCQELSSRDDALKNSDAACLIATACSLGPQLPIEPSRMVQWAKPPAEKNPGSSWRCYALGLAYYRAGQYDQALDWLKKSSASSKWDRQARAQPLLVMAMVNYRLGHETDAQAELGEARKLIADITPKTSGDPVYLNAGDWIPMQVLLREARALIPQSSDESTGPAPATSPAAPATLP